MKIKRNGKWEYVPDILFEADAGEELTYKDVEDYIETENKIASELREYLRKYGPQSNSYKGYKKIRRNGKWKYIPEILFKNGTYKDVQDYIEQENETEKIIEEQLKTCKPPPKKYWRKFV